MCDCKPDSGHYDKCIVPIIDALNAGGIETTSSCCGHNHVLGLISLRDGRWLLICDDWGEMHRVSDPADEGFTTHGPTEECEEGK